MNQFLLSFFLTFCAISIVPASAKENKGRVYILKSAKKQQKTNISRHFRSRFVSWGINPKLSSSINLVKALKKHQNKKEVVVAVVDTGIDSAHPFLKENLFVKTGSISSKNYGVSFSGKRIVSSTPTDTHGHGTHVAGIIKSVYPKVKIMALKYYDPKASGQANLEATIKALEYAVNSNVDIINYSGGGPEPSVEELRVLREAERKGILIVAAAGNEYSNIDQKQNAYYPASYGLSNIITVSSHNQEFGKVKSANWGTNSVDISAPGYKIRSAIPNGGAAFMTGTSQATAFVTGVAGLILSNYSHLTPQEIKQAIITGGKKQRSLKSQSKEGKILDALGALQNAAKIKKRHIAKEKKAS